MPAKVAPLSNDFEGLARYLIRGREPAPNLKRVAWIRRPSLENTSSA